MAAFFDASDLEAGLVRSAAPSKLLSVRLVPLPALPTLLANHAVVRASKKQVQPLIDAMSQEMCNSNATLHLAGDIEAPRTLVEYQSVDLEVGA
jgi:hypothetical protein